MKCAYCNTELPDVAKFCLSCGKKVLPPAGTCPVCGTQNVPEARFCGACGARLMPQSIQLEVVKETPTEVLGEAPQDTQVTSVQNTSVQDDAGKAVKDISEGAEKLASGLKSVTFQGAQELKRVAAEIPAKSAGTTSNMLCLCIDGALFFLSTFVPWIHFSYYIGDRSMTLPSFAKTAFELAEGLSSYDSESGSMLAFAGIIAGLIWLACASTTLLDARDDYKGVETPHRSYLCVAICGLICLLFITACNAAIAGDYSTSSLEYYVASAASSIVSVTSGAYLSIVGGFGAWFLTRQQKGAVTQG